VLTVGLLAWAAPVVVVLRHDRAGQRLLNGDLFFSGAAVVTFGSACTVLAYVAQRAVEVFHWLAPGEMVRGLALAEHARPGHGRTGSSRSSAPTATRHPESLDGGRDRRAAHDLVTPCLLFIFLGAPLRRAAPRQRNFRPH
jgi:chromate transporter